MTLASIADLLQNDPAETQQWVSIASDLSTMYDEFANTDWDEEDYRAPGIHASELYPCLRKAVYSLTGAPKKNRTNKFWRQRFKMGHAIHAWLQNDFKRMAARTRAIDHAKRYAAAHGLLVEFEKEVPCSPEHQEIAAFYKIYSACDGIFTFRETADGPPVLRVGLEIKSEAPDGFAALKKPKPEHVRQGHIYMGCLDLPLMWFVYMNKGNQNNTNSHTPWMVTFNPAIWEELEARMLEALHHQTVGTIPERVETIVCQFCPWAHICDPDTLKSSTTPNPRKERF